MAITIDYSDPAEYVIQIPRLDMTLVSSSPTEIRELNIDAFRITLADLQDDAPGVWAVTAFDHTPPFTLAGVTLARVLEIFDPYFIEFEDGLYNVNIVGGNSNISDKVIKNQVGVNTANSAGLQDPFALQAAAFAGGVAVDPNSAFSGTTFPIGTRANPVNNLTDAKAIAEVRGYNQIFILDDMTFDTVDFSAGYVFIGDSPVTVEITLNAGINVSSCVFKNATITGTLDGDNTLLDCVVDDINFFNGSMRECALTGTITLGGGIFAQIYDCWSGVAGGGSGLTPTIDMGGTGQSLLIRNYSGGIKLTNCSDATADSSIDMNSGRVVFDGGVTDGDFYIRGIATVSDGSAGGNIFDQTISTTAGIVMKLLRNRTVTDPVAGTYTVYDDDSVTVLYTGSLWEDAAGTTGYQGDGAERRDRLT